MNAQQKLNALAHALGSHAAVARELCADMKSGRDKGQPSGMYWRWLKGAEPNPQARMLIDILYDRHCS